ncbi:hypothetical protein ACO2Q8_00825 [Larkinella sp. VNQ87]|uniref:hypothetical protein n=1 Tax=Larkinella sp. VNQ87 TaxID=3400921 RepID=UPI003C0533B4
MLKKLFDFITPFTLVAGLGFMMVGNGLLHLNEENNILHFFFGIPLIGMALGAHFLTRRILNQNTLQIWLMEGLLVGLVGLAFYYVW